MGNIGIAPLPATAHSTILSICILHIRWRVFFIIVTKETKSKTVYEEVEDLKLNNVVSGDFLRTQPSHGDFFFSRSQSQQRIRSTSIIFGAIFLFPIFS